MGFDLRKGWGVRNRDGCWVIDSFVDGEEVASSDKACENQETDGGDLHFRLGFGDMFCWSLKYGIWNQSSGRS